MSESTERRHVGIDGASIEIILGGEASSRPLVGAAHPTDVFGEPTAELLGSVARAPVACVNAPLGADATGLETMVEHIESARRALGRGPWIFWGMSGGGWLAQIYARRYPEALHAIVVESACPCFRERLADPACVLSPSFPAWREGLGAAGLLPETPNATDAAELEWQSLEGIGRVLRRRDGPALLVSPAPLTAEMERAMPVLLGFDARPWLRSIEVPTLVLCGGADPILPIGHARAVAEAIPKSTFVIVDGAGHVPSTTEPARVGRAFDRFVEKVRP